LLVAVVIAPGHGAPTGCRCSDAPAMKPCTRRVAWTVRGGPGRVGATRIKPGHMRTARLQVVIKASVYADRVKEACNCLQSGSQLHCDEPNGGRLSPSRKSRLVDCTGADAIHRTTRDCAVTLAAAGYQQIESSRRHDGSTPITNYRDRSHSPFVATDACRKLTRHIRPVPGGPGMKAIGVEK